ncbi:MAG: threonine ammonia-lyase [Bdellovibrionaceae bacterium]|nr:threonine ammonia-lyase [Pseudobdellovibrionaceae bacterium]
MKPLNLDDLKKAYAKLPSELKPTPFSFSNNASQRAGSSIYIKYENLQKTGSFKVRGAYNKISSLLETNPEIKKKGVWACSAGNHAQGVAWVASQLGCPSTVVMPKRASLAKVEATKGYGAKVISEGKDIIASMEYAAVQCKKQGAFLVHPYDDPKIVAGQGGIGLEIIEQFLKISDKPLDSVIVPIGGGGLISGVALAIKSLSPSTKVYGVVSELCPIAYSWFHNLNVQEQVSKNQYRISLADGTYVSKPSEYNYKNYIQKYVDDVVFVTEEEVAETMVFLLERTKTLVEGSGALSMAAAFYGNLDLGKNSCVLLSGGNVNLNFLASIIERGYYQMGKRAKLKIVAADKPGLLTEITKIIAQYDVNILSIQHNRLDVRAVGEVLIEVLLELTGKEQLKLLNEGLRQKKFFVQ